MSTTREDGFQHMARLAFHRLDSGDPQGAKEKFLGLLEVARARSDKRQEAWALKSIALVCRRTGDLEQALSCARRANQLAAEAGDTQLEGEVLSAIGNVLSDLGEAKASIAYLKKSAELYEALGCDFEYAQVQNNLATVLATNGDSDAAQHLLTKSLSYAERSHNRELTCQILNNLALLLLDSGEFVKAEDLLLQDLELCLQVKDSFGEAVTLCNLGELEMRRGRAYSAKQHFRQAAELLRALGANHELEIVEANLQALHSQ